uniref:Ig-like domain-containing protein n=1 Tax=Mola mola TaxID=94237 RepID=A0A3Q3WDL1_MOLML
FYTKSHVSWFMICAVHAQVLGNESPVNSVFKFKLSMCPSTEANSTCTTETNPLTLDPPEVIGRYDDIVMVNCTTSYDFHDKMYWKVGQADPIEEEEISFVTLPLTLSNWSLNAKCNININDSIECSKNLEITVYKLPDVVSVVGPDVMVEGTEYPLVCDIINVTPLQNLNVKWYRGNETVHTQIVSGTSVTPVNVSLTLMVTAGRDLGGAHFRCEVELIFGANGPEFIPTATSSPYTAANLKVKWYRGNETVHTQMVSGTSVTPVNVSLTLMVTAGRDLAGAHFRCEVQLHLGPNGPESIPTVTSSPYTAAVHCEFLPIFSLM